MSITELGNLAQWLQIAQSIVAITGFPILILTMLMIWRQAQYAHHTAMSQVYQNAADNFVSLQKYFVDHPEYKLYFYGGKGIDTSDPDYVRVSSIAEFWLHAVHNLTIHRRYMGEYPWHVWEGSLRDVYNTSPTLQHFLREHAHWYTDEVHRMLTDNSPPTALEQYSSASGRG